MSGSESIHTATSDSSLSFAGASVPNFSEDNNFQFGKTNCFD